jgi:hypothetical protein
LLAVGLQWQLQQQGLVPLLLLGWLVKGHEWVLCFSSSSSHSSSSLGQL